MRRRYILTCSVLALLGSAILYTVPAASQNSLVVSVGAGLTFMHLEGKYVLTLTGAVRLQLCPDVVIMAELGQGVLGWRAGEIRFSALSTLVYVLRNPPVAWYVGFGMGFYACPCVGEDTFGSFLTGLDALFDAPTLGALPTSAHLKITSDRGLGRSSNLVFMLSATMYPLAWDLGEVP